MIVRSTKPRVSPRSTASSRMSFAAGVALRRTRGASRAGEGRDLALPYPVVQHLDADAWDALHPDLKLFVRVQSPVQRDPELGSGHAVGGDDRGLVGIDLDRDILLVGCDAERRVRGRIHP